MTDRIDAMQAFIAVCDAHGFAAAARRLDVAPSMVTRLVAALETRLGVRLLQRTTRSVGLTDAGARFLERARRIVAEMEEAEHSAQNERGEPRGRLVIAAPVLLGRMHIGAVVSRYLTLYPQVSTDLRLSDRFVNLVEEGVDLAIRIGELADSGLIARGLGYTRPLLAATPAYLARHGTPARPEDLLTHRLIAFSGVTPRHSWTFHRDGKVLQLAVEPHFLSNSGEAALAHALADGGIVSALSYQIVQPRQEGRLVEVLPGFAPPAVPIQAIFPTSRLLSRKVRAFLDLLEQAAPGWQLREPAP
jgi:DNA-binding transcriptional LysR family regulator